MVVRGSQIEVFFWIHTFLFTSGRQLKITFLNVLDYFKYSDTNISKKIFFRENSFLSEEAKKQYIFKTYQCHRL